ncbi:pilus assembly protein PilM [Patescibacteria group bacterium]|nr:pilus assembly protein PilM [Patescibacteria group bacterium]MBU2036263.1 pilus assembly protein PilM [Patescibacteria group bacterium]
MGVGLDIGSKTIKIVELKKEGNSFKLSGSGIIGFKGASPDRFKEEKELGDLAQVIKKLHKEAQISSKDVTIAIPEEKVFTRIIKFPLLTDQEIASAIKWEAEQYIPIPISEAIIQHQIISRNEREVGSGVKVLLVAVSRNLVEIYVKLLQSAGLNTIKAETELLALSRVLAPKDRVSLIIDFGASSTDIAICDKGILSFSRSIPTAGNAFTRAVAQNLNVTPQQAEEYKKAYGLSSSQLEGKIKGALDPIVRLVSDEIKKAIYYYQTEEKGDAPSAVILSGGSSGLPEAVSYLSKALGLEIVVGNPFSRVSLTPEVSKVVAPYAPLYSIAVGLAMTDI